MSGQSRLFAKAAIDDPGIGRDPLAMKLLKSTCYPATGRILIRQGKQVLTAWNWMAAENARKLEAVSRPGRKQEQAGTHLDSLVRVLGKTQVVSATSADASGILAFIGQLLQYGNRLVIIDRYFTRFREVDGVAPFILEVVKFLEASATLKHLSHIEIDIHNLLKGMDPAKYPTTAECIKAWGSVKNFALLENLVAALGPGRSYTFNLHVHLDPGEFHSRVCMIPSPSIGFCLTDSFPQNLNAVHAPGECFFCPKALLRPYAEMATRGREPDHSFRIGPSREKQP